MRIPFPRRRLVPDCPGRFPEFKLGSISGNPAWILDDSGVKALLDPVVVMGRGGRVVVMGRDGRVVVTRGLMGMHVADFLVLHHRLDVSGHPQTRQGDATLERFQ